MPTFYPEQTDYLTKLNALSDGDLANTAITTGTTKTVNIGTAGLSGSTTNISLGSAVTGATNSLLINGLFGYRTFTLTTSATTANQVLATLPIATFRSVSFQLQIVSGSSYQICLINAVHNGTTAYPTGTITPDVTTNTSVVTGVNLATYTLDINGGNIRLLTTPVNAVTVYKVVARMVVV